MKYAHGRTWSMARKLKNVENETQILYDQEYGENTEKPEKMLNAHCRIWNMARKLKNVENEKLTWQDLEYGEKQ